MCNLKMLLSETEIKEIGLTPPEDQIPLWEHWADYVEERRHKGRSDDTIRGIRDTLRALIKRTELCTVEQINDALAFSKVIRQLSENYNWKPRTAKDTIRKIRYYFEWLQKWEIIEKVNLKKLEDYQIKPTEQETFTREQVLIVSDHIKRRIALYDRLQYYRDLLLFEVLQLTGARNCEILDMKVDAIYRDPDDGKWKLTIQGKKQKGRARYYNIHNYLVATHQEYMALRYSSPESLQTEAMWISAKYPSQALTSNGLKMLYRRISDEVGFKVSGHRYRRFVATELDRKGVRIQDIARHLGHTRLSTTELYIARSASLTEGSCTAMQKILNKDDAS